MTWRLLRPILALACIALATWQTRLLLAQLGGRDDAPDVETAPAERGPFAVGITREGVLESGEISSIRAPMGGSTLSWLIEDGQNVKKGDLVAKVDTSQFRFEVENARVEYQNRVTRVEQERRERERDVESAGMDVDRNLRALGVLSRSLLTETEQGQAQVGYDQWNLTFAQTDYDKQSRLNVAGIVPGTDVEQSQRVVRSKEYALTRSEKNVSYLDAQHGVKKSQGEADVETAEFGQDLARRRIKEGVQRAQERVRRTKEHLDELEENLVQSELRADREGVVVLGTTWDQGGHRTLREGDRVRPRMKVCDITVLSALRAMVRVDEAAASRLRIGQEAVITVKGLPKREFQGKVATIGAVARSVQAWEDPNAVPDQRVFDVGVTIANVDPKVLRPGVTVNVKFVFRRLPASLFVALSALFDRPPRGEFVYVQRGNRFVERKVVTGERNDEAVVIREGLRPGERVALSDPTKVETD